jgi:hypothetical protein
MANAKQIEKELIEWHNAQTHEGYYEDEFEKAEYFEEVWGNSDWSIYEHLYWFGHGEKPVIEIPSGKVSIKEDVGGPDEGSTRYVILSVNDQFFKVSGYYASWDGDNWDNADLEEVFPKEVTVTKYVNKKGK